MIRVTLKDPLIALEAGEWCNEQFGNNWKLHGQNLFSGDPHYAFEFPDTQKATLFGLRWLEHT